MIFFITLLPYGFVVVRVVDSVGAGVVSASCDVVRAWASSSPMATTAGDGNVSAMIAR